MEALYFNVDSGYLEGIVRGYRNSLLTSGNYSNLTQCETLDGPLPSLFSPVLPSNLSSQT